MAGARTAECAAVCCCIPCTVLDLVVLAVVKLPAGLCRKAARKRKEKKKAFRRKKKKKNALTDEDDSETSAATAEKEEAWAPAEGQSAAEKLQIDKEMWDKFYSTGFWRSASQRD